MSPAADPTKGPVESELEASAQFEALIEYLRRNRGFDFTGYKRSSLMRRVSSRMHAIGVESYAQYIEYLEAHLHEFVQLFNTILINVTSFFRDPAAWAYLSDAIVPKILAGKGAGEPVRIWSAGCASGQEAHTLVMVFAEAVGIDRFRQKVKIYATDVDGEALNQARQASYSAKEIHSVPPPLRERYFEASGNHFLFRADLRHSVIFGRHDLVQDAPISRLDLLVCRNTLMYLNAETQARILDRFRFALNSDGYLFMGRAEMLLIHSSLFLPVDLRYRIFAPVSKIATRGHPHPRKSPAGEGEVRLVQPKETCLDPDADLQAVSAGLRQGADHGSQAGAISDSLLGGHRLAVAALDPELRVLAWDKWAEELWGVCSDETIGRLLLALDLGLPAEQVIAAVSGCLSGKSPHQEVAFTATDRRGRRIFCRVACLDTTVASPTERIVVLFMEEAAAGGIQTEDTAAAADPQEP